MYDRILVGADGGPGGDDAAALARALSGPTTHLTLAHVDVDVSVPWRGANLEWDAVEREETQRKLSATRERIGVDAELRIHTASSVGRGLHEVAEAERADLLVVGSSRHGLLGRVLHTEKTRAALDGAPCAVAVAPTGFAERTVHLSEIGVAYDGSAEAENALSVARTIAGEHGARLSAFMAVEFPTYLADGTTVVDEDTVDAILGQARAKLESLGGVEPHVAYGRPAEELALYGASVDLLVVGSRGYGPLRRLVHGSTSSALTRKARCPLLIIPRGLAPRATPTEEMDRERVSA